MSLELGEGPMLRCCGMQLSGLGRVAYNHSRNALAELLYLNTGQDLTRPVTIHGIVNEICNYKCRYCECWRMPEYKPEMSIDEWKKALRDLKEFRGKYHVEFSGGEPYLKKGFLELIAFCHSEGLQWGVTTNGSAFNSERVVRATMAARPFNVNISIDSMRPEIHNYTRGIEDSLSKILSGLAKVREIRKSEGLHMPIIIKPVVSRLNFRYLPEMVEWIQEIGATAINFQPVDRWTPETYNELWIETPEDLDELRKVRDEILRMKRAGAPILNSELILQAWDKHFLEEKAPKEYMPCRVGMRNYFIRPDGNVEVCWYFKPIGNVKTATAREIWYGEEARQRRKETVECDSLCLFTCLSQKTVIDKAKMALTLITGVGKEHWKPAAAKAAR
ncbi:MAG: radical SAM protein [Bryobacteraceae bacterium]|nr:radical SAM protein [Bryobacteraceae bacterium]